MENKRCFHQKLSKQNLIFFILFKFYLIFFIFYFSKYNNNNKLMCMFQPLTWPYLKPKSKGHDWTRLLRNPDKDPWGEWRLMSFWFWGFFPIKTWPNFSLFPHRKYPTPLCVTSVWFVYILWGVKEGIVWFKGLQSSGR